MTVLSGVCNHVQRLNCMSPHVSAATSVRWTLFNMSAPRFLSVLPLIPCRYHLLILTHSLSRHYLLVRSTTCKLILLYRVFNRIPEGQPQCCLDPHSATSHSPSVGSSNILPSNFLTVSNSMSFIFTCSLKNKNPETDIGVHSKNQKCKVAKPLEKSYLYQGWVTTD